MRERGTGRIFQPKYRDRTTREWCISPTWWIAYSHRGRKIRESSKSKKRSAAVALLKRRLGEMGQGRLVGPEAEKVTFERLAEGLRNDYRNNGRKSLKRANEAIARLAETFGMHRAVDITSDRIVAYQTTRLDGDAAPATVHYECAVLKRMFTLAVRAGRLAIRPYIPSLDVSNNARTGFFERDTFEAVRTHLPDDEQPVADVAYITGWRVPTEILTRQWKHVDLKAGWLRLEPGETKNGEGRQFPLTPDLRRVLEKQRARTLEVERDTGAIIPWVFHRNGKPIKSLYGAWRTACKDAGYPQMLMHDLRRTAVRNLERAGVPRSAAMKMTGHKTEAVYRRYAIVDEAMLAESGAKLQTLHASHARTARVVGFPVANGQSTGKATTDERSTLKGHAV